MIIVKVKKSEIYYYRWKSMVRWKMLSKIDLQLCQAFSEYNNKPFSERSIILFEGFQLAFTYAQFSYIC